jgi:hypothetical protein
MKRIIATGLLAAAVVACDAGDLVTGGSRASERTSSFEVPTSCLRALELADQALELAADGFDVVADILGAASSLDVAGVERGNAQLASLTPSARVRCRRLRSRRPRLPSPGPRRTPPRRSRLRWLSPSWPLDPFRFLRAGRRRPLESQGSLPGRHRVRPSCRAVAVVNPQPLLHLQ